MIKAGGKLYAQSLLNSDTLKTAANELAEALEAINRAEQTTKEKIAGVFAVARPWKKMRVRNGLRPRRC